MKDWRLWAFLIGIYLMIKMCGGCNGCGSDSDTSDDEFKRAIEIRLISKFNAESPHISTIEKISDNPSTYRFEFDYKDVYGNWQHKTAHCTFWEDGELKEIY